jgi:glycosyltransferase involved in cell wall biosynthesis
LRIAIILNNICGVGGVERVVTTLSNYLVRQYQCEIDIISLFSEKNQDIFYELDSQVQVIHLNNKNLKNLKVINQFYKLSKNTYNHILCCSTSIATLSLLIKLLNRNTKIYAWEHSQYDHASKLTKLIRNAFYRYLDGIITLSKHDGLIFSERFKNVHIIPNFKPFVSKRVSSNLNKKLIAVGRLGFEKGFDMLIEAYNLAHVQLDDWVLEIYGEGAELSNLENKIRKYNLEDRVFLKPFTPNIKEKYLEASIYICSSRSESFSMVIVEAMECGLPCISFNCKIGPKEIISENVDGFLVNDFNINEMAQKIILLANNDSMRMKMGKNAKEKSKKFNVDNIINNWEVLLSLNKKKMVKIK